MIRAPQKVARDFEAIFSCVFSPTSWSLADVYVVKRLHSATGVMLVYPTVRYAAYSAVAMALVTVLHPLVTMGITLIMVVVAPLVQPTAQALTSHGKYVRVLLWIARRGD